MNTQQIYNTIVGHLRNQGNPWGDPEQRGWFWINERNPNERCAISILFDKSIKEINLFSDNTDYSQSSNPHKLIAKTIGRELEPIEKHMLFCFVTLFDHIPPKNWEKEFEVIAKIVHVDYNSEVKNENILIVEEELV